MDNIYSQTSSNRKRPRSASPTPSAIAKQLTYAPADPSLDGGYNKGRQWTQQLRDENTRIIALNELLKLSSSHEVNFAIPSEEMLFALISVFYELIQWNHPTISRNNNDDDDDYYGPVVFDSRQSWTIHPCDATRLWAEHCHSMLGRRGRLITMEQLKMLEVIAAILRNFSFVAANLRLMAYSSDCLAVLIGCLYESKSFQSSGDDSHSNSTSTASSGNAPSITNISTSTLALPALHTLVNLAPFLDVTGQKLYCDKLFYSESNNSDGPLLPNISSFGQVADGSWGFGGLKLAKRLDTKEDTVQDVTKEMILELTEEFLIWAWSIFPALGNILVDPHSPRLVVMMTVELLQEFINQARVGVVGAAVPTLKDELPNVRAILVNMPDKVLDRFVDLLYVPRLGPDSLEYIDPVHNIVTRVTTLKLLMGYDATVDTDVRDRALDLLVPLLELDSPRMAQRLGVKQNNDTNNGGTILCTQPRLQLFDALSPILTTQAGRNEAPLLASQLLRELSKAEENKVGFAYIQERMVALASRDPKIAQLVWNHLYVQPTPTNDNNNNLDQDNTIANRRESD